MIKCSLNLRMFEGVFGVHNFSLLGMEARGINEALEFAFINGG